ncbi:MAG: hypothetical protein HQK54_11375 [Oligoflexales bacterium]|nr:hypothetical protein [Oligoflexales bacterium]
MKTRKKREAGIQNQNDSSDIYYIKKRRKTDDKTIRGIVKKTTKEFLEIVNKSFSEILENLDIYYYLKRLNPYLYKAIGFNRLRDFVEHLVESKVISKRFEGKFGDNFFEPIAAAVSEAKELARWGKGIDLIIKRQKTTYLVSIKSSPHIFCSAAKRQQISDLNEARKKKCPEQNVVCVIGYCYGKKNTWTNGILEIAGEDFWTFLSGNPNCFRLIMEVLCKDSQGSVSNRIAVEKNKLVSKLISQYADIICDKKGEIDWSELVEINSSSKGKKRA